MKNQGLAALFFTAAVFSSLVPGAFPEGLFEPYVAYPAPDAGGVGVGDFNNDCLNDVAVTIPKNSQLYIFHQQRNGDLGDPAVYDASPSAENLAVGDLNHDGLDDVAVETGNFLGVFLQQSDGTMAQQVLYAAGDYPDAIAIGDLNNDGRDDVALPHWREACIGVFLQNGSGTFDAMTRYLSHNAGFDNMAVGDFNHDGLTDLVKMNGQGETPTFSVFLQRTDGTLATKADYYLSEYYNPMGIAAGDVTGDGREDVVIAYGAYDPLPQIAVFSQNAGGTLSETARYRVYYSPENVAVADVNLDGKKDVLVIHGGWLEIGVLLQLPGGALSPEELYPLPYASHYNAQGIAVGDINNDKCPDVVIGDYNSGLVVLYHIYTWVSSPTPAPSPSPTPGIPVLDSGDYDGDGTSDVAVFRKGSGAWSVRGITKIYFGMSSDVAVPGDYSGDGTTEAGIFRPALALWAVRGVTRTYFGKAGDIAMSLRPNPSGACVPAVYRGATGMWALRGVTRVFFGGKGDLPVPGDYDGDGVKDIGIFRGRANLWALRGISRFYFGDWNYTPVPGDYNGDGTWTAAVFRPVYGIWAVRGLTRTYFGRTGDFPIPGDFSGDGTDRIGVFRRSSGLWAIRSLTQLYFGTAGDFPATR